MSETATAPAAPAAPAGAEQQAAPAAPPHPRAWLPEEFREDPAFAKFKSMDALAKSYRETVQFVGADKATLARIPKDDTPEAWAELWGKLGRPETPQGYQFGEIEDLPGLDGFREAAHQSGLSAKQAQALAGWYAEHQGQQREMMRREAETTLSAEWGSAYQERIHAARKLMDQAGGEEVREFLEKTGFGNHPAVIRMFAKVAQQVAEPGDLKGGASGTAPSPSTMTPAEAKAEWARLQKDQDFLAKYMKGGEEEVARAKALFRQMQASTV